MNAMSTSTAARTAPIPLVGRSAGAFRFTRDHLDRLENSGILPGKYELLDGEIIDKMGQGIGHRRAVMAYIAWLIDVFGKEYVQTQAPVDVSPEDNPTNAPEPDVCVLNQPVGSFPSNPPAAAIALLVEVGDATLADDLSKKASLYARAGVVEYWVHDVQNQMLHVHRLPLDGIYGSITTIPVDGQVAALAHPDRPVRLSHLLA